MSMTVSVRVEHRSQSRYAGHRDHDLRKRVPGYVNTELSGDNSIIIEPPSAAQVRAIAEQQRLRRNPPPKRAMKSDANVATTGVITFGTKAQRIINGLPQDKQNALYLELAEALSEKLDTRLLGLVVHRDETGPHAHFTLSAANNQGHPVSKSVSPRVASYLQDLAGDVYRDLGISRGTRLGERIAAGEDRSKTVHRGVKQLHDDLPKEIAVLKDQIKDLEQRVADNERRAAKAKARAASAEGRENAAKANAERYKGREAKARTKLEKIRKELVRLQRLAKPPVEELEVWTLAPGLFNRPKSRKIRVVPEKKAREWLARNKIVLDAQTARAAAEKRQRQELEDQVYRTTRHWSLAEQPVGPWDEPVGPALEAMQGPFVQRYGVTLVEAENRLTAPPQDATPRQIAAALYRGARQKSWETIRFHNLHPDAASAVMDMAAADGLLDRIEFTDSIQARRLDRYRIEYQSPPPAPKPGSDPRHTMPDDPGPDDSPSLGM